MCKYHKMMKLDAIWWYLTEELLTRAGQKRRAGVGKEDPQMTLNYSCLTYLYKLDILLRETGSHHCITLALSIVPAHQHLNNCGKGFFCRVPES